MASKELRTFVSKVKIGYLIYSDVIQKGDFTSHAELGAADRKDLQELKIHKGAARLVIPAARGTGDFEVRERDFHM
ncbi:TPA: hypothetical protein ACH3X1_003863 [Trebouxia sp. C0004]